MNSKPTNLWINIYLEVVFVDNIQRRKASNPIKITYGGRKDASKTTSDQTVKKQTKTRDLS